MADISNIINISLITGGQASERDNPNIVTMFTSQVGVLSTAERSRSYVTAAAVAADFGSNSAAASFANVFFSQSPNPVNAGGRLVMGFWRAVDEDVAASAAILTGAELNEASVVAALQQITDGSMDIDVDATTVNVTGLNFQSITDLAGAASILSTAIAGATVTVDGTRIVITSDTTGASSTLTFATDPATGTFIGDILAISAGSGAVIVQGAAASVLSAETKVAAVTALKAEVNFKGFMFIDATTVQESKDLATWSQANDVLGYDVFSDPDELNTDPAETPWFIKLAGQTNYRLLYRLDGSRKFAASYMSRVHTVNFNAENSAFTMQLKEQSGVTAEDFSQTQIDKAKLVGLDIYSLIAKVGGLLTSGANDYTDNRYNLLAFVSFLETDMFNVLKTTGTKIPQTTAGVNTLLDQAEKTTNQFVKAGVFAPGTWTSPDTFGDLETFKRSIEEKGYYWLAGRLSDQSVADREARKSPVLQGAVKLSGAFHSVEILINVNK